MRKRADWTRDLAYLGVLPHASLVAVGAPHYLTRESNSTARALRHTAFFLLSAHMMELGIDNRVTCRHTRNANVSCLHTTQVSTKKWTRGNESTLVLGNILGAPPRV